MPRKAPPCNIQAPAFRLGRIANGLLGERDLRGFAEVT